MDGLADAGAEVLEMTLGAFCCKGIGGGGRLRHATTKEEKRRCRSLGGYNRHRRQGRRKNWKGR